jgi:hypothetical protein
MRADLRRRGMQADFVTGCFDGRRADDAPEREPYKKPVVP